MAKGAYNLLSLSKYFLDYQSSLMYWIGHCWYYRKQGDYKSLLYIYLNRSKLRVMLRILIQYSNMST